MRKIFFIGMLIVTTLVLCPTENAALTKRSFYDLFGDSLNARYWVIGLIDTNGPSGGESKLRGEGWGFGTEQCYNLNYSDKYKKIKADFKIGFEYRPPYSWWCTDLFDVTLTPFTFQKVWWPGVMGTLVTPAHKGTVLFSRTSYMSLYKGGQYTTTEYTKNTYLLALRDEYKFRWEGLNLTLGGTFINHWMENSLIDENSFIGNVPNSYAPTTITLRFSDDSPEDGNGARLFSLSYRVDDGAPTPISVSAPYEEANGANYFEKSTGPIPGTAKKVEITMSIANDYKVEISTDKISSRTVIARAPGNPTDGSAKSIIYNYGVWNCNQYIGFDVKGNIAGVKIETECEYNIKWRKYPNSGGYRTSELGVSPIFYLKANQKFENFLVGGDIFYIDPEYATSFQDIASQPGGYPLSYVDDNDDKDWYVDGTRRGSGSYEWKSQSSASELSPYDFRYDRDSDKTPDWEQELLLFTVDPPRFQVGDDRNNNGTIDTYEDDPYPDYPYKINKNNPTGLQGYGVFAGYDLAEGLSITGGYDDFGEVSTNKKTTNGYAVTHYKTKISDFGDILLYHQIKRVNDNIVDDQTEVKSEDGSVYVGSDSLNYKNSLLNIAYIESNYTGFKNLTLTNKFRFENNYQYDDSRNVRWAGFITNAKYDIKPSKILTITPQWKLQLEKGFSLPDSTYSVDRQINAFLLKVMYKIFEKTTITGGIQYKMVRLPLNTSSEYNKLTFAAQIVSRAGTYPMHIGYVRNLKNTPGSSTYAKDETTFIKIYAVK